LDVVGGRLVQPAASYPAGFDKRAKNRDNRGVPGLGPLAGELVAALPPDVRAGAAALDDLEERLRSALAACGAAWPGVVVDEGVVLRHVARVLLPAASPSLALGTPTEGSTRGPLADPVAQSIANELRGLRFEGLYLVAGCLQGVSSAVACFSALIDKEVEVVLRRVPDADAEGDDVKQRMRVGLLMGADGEPAKIATYSGRGDLRSWLRTCARRMLLREAGKAKRGGRADDDALLDLTAGGDDPETRYLKERYGQSFRMAVREGLASLEVRERAMLRHRFIEDLSVDQIGVLCGVSRATAARWVKDAREQLLARTLEALGRHVGAGSVDAESIVRLLQSRLDDAASVLRSALQAQRRPEK
jgi:RNA polymerase sigma-70 factor (ECF subfamily)